ncbi:MAG: transglutaminase-like domain-containing protein, partial [Planctomycetota bacterium]
GKLPNWWALNDNNLAWVEVWFDGSWYSLGGCEATDALNRTWFRSTTKRAGAVVSTMFGVPDPGFETGERVYRVLEKSALINSTAVYSATCRIDVKVTNADGDPVMDCPVVVSVFNYGGLRPLIGDRTDGQGRVSIFAGMGEFFVSAGAGDGRAYAIAKTVPEGAIDLNLTLNPGESPAPSFWLRYPTVAEADRMAALRTDPAPERTVKNKLELREPHPLKLYEKDKDPEAEAQIDLMPDPEAFRAVLKDAGANWRNLVAPIEALAEAQRPALFEFLKRTSHLDRVELSPAIIIDHVTMAEAGRRAGLEDEIYFDYVLKAGIYLEHLDAWRGMLADRFADCRADTPEATARAVNAKIANRIQRLEQKDRLSPFMNPLQVMRSAWSTDVEAAIVAVGALRSLGIPARKMAHRAKAEFYDAGNWITFDPLDPDAFAGGHTDGSDEGEAGEAPAYVRLRLTRENAPVTDFDGYAIATFQEGAWSPLRNVDSNVDGEEIVLTVPPGEYLVTVGVRNANGDPWVQNLGVNLDPDATMSCAWSLDLPGDAGIFAFPKVRELEKMPQLQLSSVEGEDLTLDELVNEHPMLFVFFLNDHEPSTRMLPLVANAHADLAAAGVITHGICLPPSKGERTAPPSIEGLPFPLKKGSFEVGTAFQLPLTEDGNAFAELPSVLLLDCGGKTVLWMEGYDLKIEDLLKAAARMVR